MSKVEPVVMLALGVFSPQKYDLGAEMERYRNEVDPDVFEAFRRYLVGDLEGASYAFEDLSEKARPDYGINSEMILFSALSDLAWMQHEGTIDSVLQNALDSGLERDWLTVYNVWSVDRYADRDLGAVLGIATAASCCIAMKEEADACSVTG